MVRRIDRYQPDEQEIFVEIARIGEWIFTDTQVLKIGKNLCVANCLVQTSDVLVARVNATFLNRRSNGVSGNPGG